MVGRIGLLLAGVMSAVGCVANAQPSKPDPLMTVPAEVRGTWITTTANDAISTPDKTAATMKKLRDIGLNVVYTECWKNGYTEFPSETMEKLIGVAMKVNAAPKELQRDLLLETTIEAHRNGLLSIGWFEYGFMAAHKDTHNELRALGEKEGWILHDKAGNTVSKKNGFVWMNPLHPKAQQIVIDIVVDAVKKYDLDGVQLDDRICMPTDLGYDDYTRDLYAKENNGAQPPANEKDPAWIKWRADKITAFAARFATEVRKVNPNLIISVSPAPYPWSYENYACDWPVWTKWGGESKWDEYIPQNYRMNYKATKTSIEEGFSFIGDRRKDLIAGIRVVGDGPDMTASDTLDSIRFTREAGLGGHVLWFSRGVLDVYPKELTAFYNVAQFGQSPHPARGASWRKLPVVGYRVGGTGDWVFDVKEAGKYRLITKKNGIWSEAAVGQKPAAKWTYVDATLQAAELLIDRRQ